MRTSKHWRRLMLGLGVLALAGCATPDVKVDMRGLGRLEAVLRERGRGTVTTITAESPEFARRTAAKLAADFTGFGELRELPVSGLPGSVYTGVGCWLIGVDGDQVKVLYAPTLTELGALAAGLKLEPVTPGAYPRWLDRFDNDAVVAGTLGWGVLPKDYREGLRRIGETRLNVVVDNNNANMQLRPGLYDFTVSDWAAHEAKKLNASFHLYLPWAHSDRPAWFWNQVPLPHLTPEPNYVVHPDFGYQRLAINSEFEPIPATDALFRSANRAYSEHFSGYEHFNTHFGMPELGHNVLGTTPAYRNDPAARQAWRAYLRQHRVKNAPTEIPTIRNFIETEPEKSLELNGEWLVRLTPEGAWSRIDGNDPLLLMLKSNDRKIELRREFTVSPEARPELRYLHIARSAWHGGLSPLFEVTLNGRKLECLTDTHPLAADNDQCFAVGDALREGANTIVLSGSGGPIPGYIFLGTDGPWHYPSADPVRNRLYFLVIDFASRYRLLGMENFLASFRAGDPEGRPQLVMAPWDFIDLTFEPLQRYGAFPHETGGAGAVWAPWFSRYYIGRLPLSSEPGSAPDNAAGMQQMITLYTMYGNDAATWLFDPVQYWGKPDIDQWISDNRERIRCLGKIEQLPVDLGVLRSVRNASRLHFQGGWNWDLSRGELQATGRTVNLVDPSMLVAGVRPSYRVLFDAATELLTPDELAGIERFVRNGGIFIATHRTGRHAPERADCWPISRLTGLKVKNTVSDPALPVSFTPDQTLFPSLRGRAVPNRGRVFDWLQHDQTGDSLMLEKVDPAVETVATWPDGSVAVARRKLGRGEIIVLGASFWRKAGDENRRFVADPASRRYLSELLDGLGVPRNSYPLEGSGNEDVFGEHWRSKNGLYDLYLAAKINSGAAAAEFPMSFRAESVPERLVELSEAGHPAVPFQYQDGRLTLPQVKLNAMQLRVYGAPRPDLGKAPLFWLNTLSRRWPALPELKADRVAAPDRPDPSVRNLNGDWTMVVNAEPWGELPPDDFDWRRGRQVNLNAFSVLGLADEDRAHFRREVEIPPQWKGKRVELVFASQYWFWGLNPKARLWVNGKPAPVRQPLGGVPNHCFFFPVPDSGKLVLELEIDGRIPDQQSRPRPSGVTGVFFLSATDAPQQVLPLTDWRAATEFNVTTPVQAGQRQRYLYLETRFRTPATPRNSELFLESPVHLGWLLINGQAVAAPGWMHRLNVTRLLKPAGEENVIRWWPRLCKELPALSRVFNDPIPEINLCVETPKR